MSRDSKESIPAYQHEGGPSLLAEAQILCQEVLNTTSNISVPNFPRNASAGPISVFWHTIVTGALSASNKRLTSISLLLAQPYQDVLSATVLVRTGFESAADLVFIGRDFALLLPQFLNHGLVPTTEDERLQIEARVQTEGVRVYPRRRWRQLSDICDALGWQEEYEKVYPVTSDTAHGGVSQAVSEYLELTEGSRSEEHKALVLVTGIFNHLRVAEVAAEVLGEGINSDRLSSAKNACENLHERTVFSLGHSRQQSNS